MTRHLACLLLILAFFTPGKLSARVLEGKTGLGASFPNFQNLPALSLRYHFTRYLSATFIAGFDTSDASGATVVGGKLLRIARLEENLNLYVGAGAFVISQRTTATTATGTTTSTQSGLELSGLIGAEFFLMGLSSLALQFETGIAMRTIGKVSFHTIGAPFGNVGIHYYF